ncbi:hypothetical protein BLL52_1967 [Rhodoferax antarcticus ANT.BR]|uniref:Uncharacterized protein n=1 Tax=Rhodoferax antarcticus ANT.BR TaxID=1111071 RepID=A0A1Q8YCF8_9BURK|nr:hypothetical protein BLL52_1967 [Rhodoferax antarcticus ANT.BR]
MAAWMQVPAAVCFLACGRCAANDHTPIGGKPGLKLLWIKLL